jgi:tetratricopeptide (TPR) repeat protein
MTWMLRTRIFRRVSFVFFLIAIVSDAQQPNPVEGNSSNNETFEQISARAASFREAGRVDDAIRFYEHALKMRPDWAEGWWYVGTLNYDADRYVEAIPALQSLVANLTASDPQKGPALAFLGLSEFEIKDYKNALLHLQQAHKWQLADDPELEKVTSYHLALLLNRSGEFEKTVELLTPAIKRNRQPDEIKVALGMALLRVPLLPVEVDPGKDALLHAAGEAAVLLDRGDLDIARKEFQQLLVEYPKTPYLHYAHASALAAAGKPEEALKELADETKVSPRDDLPYIQMAMLNLQLHNAKQALAAARQAVFYAPGSAAAHETLARTLQALGEIQEATKEFATSKNAETSLVEIADEQRVLYSRSSSQVDASRQTGAMTAGSWRDLGTSYYAAGRFGDAITAFKDSTGINPNDGDVWALLGLSEFETRDYKNALVHLERGRELGFAGNATAVHVARYDLASLLNRNGEFDRATELLTLDIESGSVDEQIKIALGMALLRIALLPEELEHSRNSLVSLAGETAALLSASKYDQAFLDFQQLLKMNPATPNLHYAYGSALASASRYDEAEEQLLAETKITPGSALPFLRRSSIALRLQRADKAAELARQAIQLAPQSAEGHYLLGRSLLELDKKTDSVRELEIARRLAPNSPEVHFSLARAYEKIGQPDAAAQERKAFERLNSAEQNERTAAGSAYIGIQNANGMQTFEGQKFNQTQPSLHPE